eukprot:Clim_evm21s139 gene=Clim_evmTU21s139
MDPEAVAEEIVRQKTEKMAEDINILGDPLDSAWWGWTKVGLYFAALFWAFFLVILAQPIWDSKVTGLRPATYLSLAGISLLITWYQILSWVFADAANYEDATQWVQYSDLFDSAYMDVMANSARYWWSSSLLHWVCVGVVFLRVESSRYNVSTVQATAFCLGGFLGAISVAFSLFFSVVQAARGVYRYRAPQMSWPAMACPMIGILCIELLRYPEYPRFFSLALFGLHVILVVPVIWPPPLLKDMQREDAQHVFRLTITYAAIAGASTLSWWSNCITVLLREFNVQDAITEGFSTPLQTSISSDICLTTFASMLLILHDKNGQPLVFAAMATLFSPASAFAWYLLQKEITDYQNHLPYRVKDGRKST